MCFVCLQMFKDHNGNKRVQFLMSSFYITEILYFKLNKSTTISKTQCTDVCLRNKRNCVKKGAHMKCYGIKNMHCTSCVPFFLNPSVNVERDIQSTYIHLS